MQEIWKDIPGYEGQYQASNLGNVRSVDRITKCKKYDRFRKGKILKPQKRGRYLKVTLTNYRQISIHRLIAITFLEKNRNSDVVNHKNNNPHDNRASNLEWCSQSENVSHSYKNGYGKPNNCRAVYCSNGMLFNSMVEADKFLKVPKGTVWRVVHGYKKNVKGLSFNFKED